MGILVAVIVVVVVAVVVGVSLRRRRAGSADAVVVPARAPRPEPEPMTDLEDALAQVTDRSGTSMRDRLDSTAVDELRITDDTGPLLRRALDHVDPAPDAPDAADAADAAGEARPPDETVEPDGKRDGDADDAAPPS